MQTETPQVLKTFRETLDELKGSNKEISKNVDLLKKCLQENKNDNPSTKDIIDAVTAIRTEDLLFPPQTYINAMSSLVDNYLKKKKIKPEQSFVNPLEVFANPFGAARNFIQDIEGSFKNPIKTAQNIYQDLQVLGLSEESKFVNKILEEILQPQEKFDNGQIKDTKKNILKAYFENYDVTFDDFKNLLKINQIDDPKSQNDLFISFLKRGNLDETKFVKNVKDFLQDKDNPTAEYKGRILEEYLVYRNEEVTKDKVSALANQIELKIYPKGTIDNTRSIEELVDDINSRIESKKPRTDVVATASNLGTATSSTLVR